MSLAAPSLAHRSLLLAALAVIAVATGCARGGQRVGLIAFDAAAAPLDAADELCANHCDAARDAPDACPLLAPPACVEPQLVTTAAEVRAAPGGAWLRVANSRLRAVAPTAAEARDGGYNGIVGVRAIMSTSGAVLDTRERRLLVWGGGHTNYLGNEVYAFGLDALRWSMLVPPSTIAPGAPRGDALPDGRPASRETFNNLAYVADRHAMFSFGGGLETAGCSGGAWMLDLTTLAWERRTAPTTGIPRPGPECGCAAAYDPIARRVLWFNNGNIGLFGMWGYDTADAGAWSLLSGGAYAFYATVAVDTRRHQVLVVGSGRNVTYDLAPPYAMVSTARPDCSAGGALARRGNPGVDYDPVRDRFVAWSGATDATGAQIAGGPVYVRDGGAPPDAWSMAPGPCGVVGDRHGPYGRWRYVPSLDAFVLAVSVDEDVFLYRPRD